jgi:hypothetical protein
MSKIGKRAILLLLAHNRIQCYGTRNQKPTLEN